MEFLGLVQEGDKILRQWRWRFSKSMMKATGKGDGRFEGEFWDFAETLIPYRTLDPTGGVYIVESWSAKCTDADVTAALSLRTKVPIKDLLECKALKVDEEMVPKMEEGLEDLRENEISYYTWQVFGDIDAAQRAAAAGDKEDTLTQVADYLIRGERGWSEGSVSDPCYLACKEELDASEETQERGEDECDNGAAAAVQECLKNSFAECDKMPLLSVEAYDCDESAEDNAAATSANRALEDEQPAEDAEGDSTILVPAMQDGVANLLRASPTFQATLAQTLGADVPKVVLNVTHKKASARRMWAPPACTTAACKRRFGDPDETNGCPLRPKAGQTKKSKKCQTCEWHQCQFMREFPSAGTTNPVFVNANSNGHNQANDDPLMNHWIWQFMCLSFSLCFRQFIIVVQLKFAPVQGKWTFSIILEVCVEGYGKMFGIPYPPFFCQACVGGQLHITVDRRCSQLGPFNMSGSGYVRKSVDFYFYIYPLGIKVGFTFAGITLEVGVKVSYAFHKWWQSVHCWRTDGRRRRRRYGKGQRPGKGGRRRAKWGCHWRIAESCDICKIWYVYLTLFGKLKLGFECWEWVKAKNKEGWLFFEISIPKGIGWRGIKWGWNRLFKHCCFAKYNR